MLAPRSFRPKRLFATLVGSLTLLGALTGPLPAHAGGPPPLAGGKTWKLIWSDEFDGNSVDPSKWALPGDNVPRSSGLWSNSQIKVGGGVIQFQVSRINGKLASACLSSQGRLEVTQGYFEMRAKLPRNPGYRPAFWLSSRKINTVDDPSHPTEIDVLEYPSRSGRVNVNLHWNGYGAFHQTVGTVSSVATPPGEFHTYGVWWASDGYHFYVDGQLVWFSPGGGASTGPEFMKLGNELFPKEPLVQGRQLSNFPPDDNFTVDYVRVYQVQ